MDRISVHLLLDPLRFRDINALRPGDTTATGQRLGKDCSALQVLREAVKRTDFKKRRREIASANLRSANGSSANGSSANGSSANGSSANGSSAFAPSGLRRDNAAPGNVVRGV